MWTPAEMMKLKTIKDVQISPDNKWVLFVATEAILSDDKDFYISRIYKTKFEGDKKTVAITPSDSSATQPQWSPDGRHIAFISDRSGAKNLFIMDPDGNNILAVTKSKIEVQTFRWAPDSRRIAFVRAQNLHKKMKSHKTARIYTKNVKINKLWLIDFSKKVSTPLSLTTNEYSVRGGGDFGALNIDFDWSPDGTEITFAYSPSSSLDDFYHDSSLATIKLSTRIISPMEKNAQHESMPRYSPDGQWLCHLASEKLASFARIRHVVNRSKKNGTFQQLAPSFNEGPYLEEPNLLGWTHDSKHVLIFEPKRTKFHLVMLPLDGSPAIDVETKNCFFRGPSLSQDSTKLGFIVESTESPQEVFVSSLPSFHPVQISRFNENFTRLPHIKTEIIQWKADDGEKIEGLLTYPLGFLEGKGYPLLLIIHGGPMDFFYEVYAGNPQRYPLAAFAQEGFLVLRPNPRGSTGYGKRFRSLNAGDWGGKDFEDLMAGVDTLIDKGWADPKRLGVMGWSYGGYLAAWAVTQTNRFKAASIGAAISNLISMAGTTDLYRLLPGYLQNFWQNTEFYHKRSPVYYVPNVKAACLIQHGLEDKRVPVSQAFELYNALESNKKLVELVLYPRMEHLFTEPGQLLDSMERNLAWFKKHLLV